MPLKLVIGPANSAKVGAVLGTFRARLRRDPWLVVPTRADVAHYDAELSRDGARQGGRVATFSGLGREIAARTGGGGRVLGPLQRERLVADAIVAARPAALAPVAGTRGFLRAAGGFVAELERTLITPQRLTAAVRAWPEAPPAVHEVAAIYDRYARELERLGRVDGDGFAWRALDALRARREAWGDTPVLFYGFDDFTPLERDAIETLAKVVDTEVVVSLPYEPGRAAFAARGHSVAELGQLAAGDVQELPPLDDWYDAEARDVLHHLERGLFETEPRPARIDPGDAVSLLVAGGERAEIELVAARILRLLHEEAVPGERIAVVLRDPARSASLVGQVFGAYGVPHSLDWKVPVAHTALGRGLLALARCALTPAEATPDDLLTYLRTPGRLARLELADRLESAVRRRALVTVEDAREAWERAPGGWPLRELDRLRGAAADSPAALLAALAREARTLFAAPHRGQAAVLDAAEEADARALTVLLDAFAELDELARAAPRRADLLDPAALIVSLGELEVALGEPPRPGAVVVSDPLAIRARRFDTVVVCGLQEGEFPRPALPEPFLTDDQRRALNTAAGLRLEPREDALADERYLFYATVSRAQRRLILSCRDADEDGNPALPSFFVDDVAALLTELPTVHRSLAEVTWPADAAPTEGERARAAALAGPRIEPRQIASLGPDAQAALRQREILSAGALESFARCPVRWLVEGELQPERFEPDPEAMARGSCIHRVLERTLGRLDWPIPAAELPAVEEIVREVVADESPAFTLGRGAAAQAAAAHEIAADVLRLVAHEAQAGGTFRPAELELRFGFADGDAAPGGHGEPGEVAPRSLPPLVLADGALRLRGVIDRVDLDAAGRALVRDYKSGARNPNWPVAKWSGESQLQVALYMVAVRELLRREPAGGVYQPLRGEDLRARGVVRDDVDAGELVVDTDRRSQEELEAELADAAERACQLAATLLAGRLTPSPETCGRDGCQYPGICRAVET